MTWIEWLNDKYWWPVVLIVVGGVLVVAFWRSSIGRVPRAVMITLGSVATMTGLAAMTLFVWGIGAIWLMLLVGIVLLWTVWTAWVGSRPSRGMKNSPNGVTL